jgi:hypothetical protein
MNNSENYLLLISACCPKHAGIDRRKFIGATAMAAAALALPLARRMSIASFDFTRKGINLTVWAVGSSARAESQPRDH